MERFSSPFIVDSSSTGQLLERVKWDEPPFTETELQRLLMLQPRMLAVEQIDAIFAPAVCIGREAALSGRCDNVYISPQGYLTVVETKLWKNQQGRREVVAQIIEYASKLSTWRYSNVEEMLTRYLEKYHPESTSRGLIDWVTQQTAIGIDEVAFQDAVDRCLRNGRFLLLIVGEGIRENAEDLVDHLNSTPRLGYTLGLVELACYRLPGDEQKTLLVPRVILRTTQVERAVVRIEIAKPDQSSVRVDVATPKSSRHAVAGGGDKEVTATASNFADQLAQFVGHDGERIIEEFLDKAARPDLGLTIRRTPLTAYVEYQVDGDTPTAVVIMSIEANRRGPAIWLYRSLLVELTTRNLPIDSLTEFWGRLHAITQEFPLVAQIVPSQINRFPVRLTSHLLPLMERILSAIISMATLLRPISERSQP